MSLTNLARGAARGLKKAASSSALSPTKELVNSPTKVLTKKYSATTLSTFEEQMPGFFEEVAEVASQEAQATRQIAKELFCEGIESVRQEVVKTVPKLAKQASQSLLNATTSAVTAEVVTAAEFQASVNHAKLMIRAPSSSALLNAATVASKAIVVEAIAELSVLEQQVQYAGMRVGMAGNDFLCAHKQPLTFVQSAQPLVSDTMGKVIGTVSKVAATAADAIPSAAEGTASLVTALLTGTGIVAIATCDAKLDTQSSKSVTVASCDDERNEKEPECRSTPDGLPFVREWDADKENTPQHHSVRKSLFSSSKEDPLTSVLSAISEDIESDYDSTSNGDIRNQSDYGTVIGDTLLMPVFAAIS